MNDLKAIMTFLGLACCIGIADVVIPTKTENEHGEKVSEGTFTQATNVPSFSEAHNREFGPAERVGTYVLCVRTVTNVVSGDNASGCQFNASMLQSAFGAINAGPYHPYHEGCTPYVAPTEKWVGTNIVRHETYITDQGIRLTRETGTALPRKVWKLESAWKEAK